ncbi:MAG: alpha/beta fold hydrolase [Myxococcales bacterium]|nr:alpha/beta fold hydrolase [Myxococcales bacterium]
MLRTISRPGATVSYEVSGDGPPLILGHSLLCDGRMWNAVSCELEQRYRVINVDARGHGRSHADGPFILESLADDWRAIMDAEGIDRAVLCGLSMGGMTAMRLALRAPSRVRALALLDTSADPEPLRNRLQYRAMAELTRRFGQIDALYGIVQSMMFGKTIMAAQPALVEAAMEQIREQDPMQIYFGARAVMDRASITEHLATLTCPTMVIVGSEDVATPQACSERIRSAVPSASLRVLDNVGHLSAVEAPTRVVGALGELFAEIGYF